MSVNGGYPAGYTDPPYDGTLRGFAEVVLPARLQAIRATLDGILAGLGHPELRWEWAAAPPVGFTCPRCGMTSHHPEDLEQGYCGNCHDWTGNPP